MSLPTPKWYGHIDGNRVHLDRRPVFDNYLSSLNGKQIELVVRERRDERSTRQLRYFHGPVTKYFRDVICALLADGTGVTLEETKDNLKAHFLSKKTTCHITGKTIVTIPSLADLTKPEMSAFIDDCVMLSAQMGTVIPSPDDVSY